MCRLNSSECADYIGVMQDCKLSEVVANEVVTASRRRGCSRLHAVEFGARVLEVTTPCAIGRGLTRGGISALRG